jgi:hypothetical protein
MATAPLSGDIEGMASSHPDGLGGELAVGPAQR